MEEPRLIKKRGITDAAINKQRKILIIAIFCVITLFISTSYALLTNFDKTDNVVVFQTGNLNMSVNNTEGLINLNNKFKKNHELQVKILYLMVSLALSYLVVNFFYDFFVNSSIVIS